MMIFAIFLNSCNYRKFHNAHSYEIRFFPKINNQLLKILILYKREIDMTNALQMRSEFYFTISFALEQAAAIRVEITSKRR